MTQREAEHIAYNWKYDGIYSFYDITADKEDLELFLDPIKRGNSVFSVRSEGELVAFFSAQSINYYIVDIGLGMKPNLTGKGIGREFVKAGLAFVRANYNPKKITLSVAVFNQRAINVYRKVGFEEAGRFMQDTNGSTYEFLKMVYVC